MSRPADGVLNDESVRLFQRGLFVESLNYKLDPHKFPSNGHEYIHKVREEEEEMFPGQRQFYESIPAFEVKEPPAVDDDKDKMKVPSLSEWKNKEATFFSRLANQLKVKRKELMEKFPCRKFPSITEEKDVCLFCLGSDLYQKVFLSDKVDEAPNHPPLLSIVLHISQEEIYTLLQYMTVWVMQTDFDHKVCRWIYALLACLQKPVSDECEEFLENFYDFCVGRTKDCDEKEKNQMYLLSSILENYFCVKAYAMGPSLDRFVPLC